MKKRIAILGSTGSIGTQTLEVISQNPDHFEVEVLTANNSVSLLIEQAKRYQPNVVVITNTSHYETLKEALKNEPVKVYAGKDALNQVVQMETIDIVVTAMVGYSGLIPTCNAIKAGKNIALANKETMVVAGEIINHLAIENKVNIYPIVSEHSAIFQCLVGEFNNEIEKIYLTASGGPFLGRKPNFFIGLRVAQKTGQKADYTKTKGFDKQYYLDLIIKAIKEHKDLSRKDVDELLWSKLPDWTTDKQKKTKINHLLSELRRNDMIENRGSFGKPKWMLK